MVFVCRRMQDTSCISSTLWEMEAVQVFFCSYIAATFVKEGRGISGDFMKDLEQAVLTNLAQLMKAVKEKS